MRSIARRALIGACAVLYCLAFSFMNSCASLAPAEVLQESGYYYGFGSGPSAAEAAVNAKRDLISNALTESSRASGIRKGRIVVDAEAAKTVKLPDLQPFARESKGGQETVVYRIKAAEWDKFEMTRETALRAELQKKLAALKDASAQPVADRMIEAAGLLDRLGREGLADVLTETGEGSLLMYTAMESFCRGISAGLRIATSPSGGFIRADTKFAGLVQAGDARPAGSVPLRIEWAAKDSEPASSSASSGPDGKLDIAFPAGESFRNRGVRLTVATDFSRYAPRSAALKDIDKSVRAETSFQHFDDAAAYFSGEVKIPGGAFTAGALARDKRAAKKEAPRQASVKDFHIDLHPVTNALYAMYLEATGAKNVPEYWDNPDYNQPDQPVIGVSYEDAVSYASWLSAQLGVTKRLPTEDEWEKAARGGQDAIYPWGDQSPADGARANYNGNGRFNATSPVGSFEAGKNAYGLFDMAGNVWQWTSSSRAGGPAGTLIVKGGSWMDGPTELRVSNRREVDPSKGYVDVGFRLVREVSHE